MSRTPLEPVFMGHGFNSPGGEDKPSHSPRPPDGLRGVRGKRFCRLGNSMEDWTAGHCRSHSLLSAESSHPALREQLKGILVALSFPSYILLLPSTLYPGAFCSFVSALCPATLSERCMEPSAKIVMIVLGLEACGWGRVGGGGEVGSQGPERKERSWQGGSWP